MGEETTVGHVLVRMVLVAGMAVMVCIAVPVMVAMALLMLPSLLVGSVWTVCLFVRHRDDMPLMRKRIVEMANRLRIRWLEPEPYTEEDFFGSSVRSEDGERALVEDGKRALAEAWRGMLTVKE